MGVGGGGEVCGKRKNKHRGTIFLYVDKIAKKINESIE